MPVVQQPQPQIVAPVELNTAPLTVVDGEALTTVSAQNRAADAIAKLMDKKLEEAEEHKDSTALNESQVEDVEDLAEKRITLTGEENSSEVVPAKKAKGRKKAKLTDAEIAQLKEDGAAKTAARKAAKEQAALGEHEEVMSPSVELENASVVPAKKAKGRKKAKLTDAEIAQLKEDGAAKTAARKAAKEQAALGEHEEVMSSSVELGNASEEEIAAPVSHHVDQAEHVAETTVVPQSEKVEPQATFAVIVETQVDGKQAISLTETQEHLFNRKNQPEEPTKIIVAPVEAPTAVNGAVADNSERHDANATQEEIKEEPVKNEVPLIVEGTKNGPEFDVTRAEEGVVNAEHQEVAAEKHKEPKEVTVTKEELKEVPVTKEELKEVPVAK